METITNKFNLGQLLELFENPLGVEVGEPYLIRYKTWHIEAKVTVPEGDSVVEKILTLGEIN